jgi:hypothetical protein
LKSQICREGRRPDYIVITNGGASILVVANGMRTVAAPDDLTCWSEAATALHDILDQTFRSHQQR